MQTFFTIIMLDLEVAIAIMAFAFSAALATGIVFDRRAAASPLRVPTDLDVTESAEGRRVRREYAMVVAVVAAVGFALGLVKVLQVWLHLHV